MTPRFRTVTIHGQSFPGPLHTVCDCSSESPGLSPACCRQWPHLRDTCYSGYSSCTFHQYHARTLLTSITVRILNSLSLTRPPVHAPAPAGGAGCNGCLTLSLPPNRGLATAATSLEQLYTQLDLASKMSRADFWALSGVIAAQYAIPHSTAAASYGYGLDPLAFRWGRADCPTAPEDPEERISDFPLSLMGFGGVLAFYATRYARCGADCRLQTAGRLAVCTRPCVDV